MEKILDLRGFSCPIPLIKTRDALNAVDCLQVIVDEPPAKENIIKFAKSQNYKVECKTGGSDFCILISK